MKIRNLVIAGALMAMTAVSAQALTIDATLTSFTTRTASLSRSADPGNGISAFSASGGGLGTFSVSAPVATGDALLDDILNGGFVGWCLEPDQSIGYNTYTFDVVALALAPSSSNSNDPMGIAQQLFVEDIIARDTYSSVEEQVAGFNNSEEHAFQMALYEAGYELTDPVFDFETSGLGTTAVTSAGATAADIAEFEIESNNGDDVSLINTYALINKGRAGQPLTTNFSGQDFMIFTRSLETVPNPAPIALMGLGLVGLVGSRKYLK